MAGRKPTAGFHPRAGTPREIRGVRRDHTHPKRVGRQSVGNTRLETWCVLLPSSQTSPSMIPGLNHMVSSQVCNCDHITIIAAPDNFDTE
ncbi:hypothetical protein TNCV_1374101 [Trichonephila clavipes]|nr:hypothetical protein TNCV_1374101 [Trichonephila clavipes]